MAEIAGHIAGAVPVETYGPTVTAYCPLCRSDVKFWLGWTRDSSDGDSRPAVQMGYIDTLMRYEGECVKCGLRLYAPAIL